MDLSQLRVVKVVLTGVLCPHTVVEIDRRLINSSVRLLVSDTALIKFRFR